VAALALCIAKSITTHAYNGMAYTNITLRGNGVAVIQSKEL